MGTDEFGHEVGDPQFLPWRTSLEVIYRVFHLDWEKALSSAATPHYLYHVSENYSDFFFQALTISSKLIQNQ